ncbi:MAG: deacylase [Alphaproteobacteria bacterium]|nr:deacylase [Alphaproteobacteria bacterium]
MGGGTRIAGDIDFEADGKQVTWLKLPFSVHRSAYGHIAIPIAVIKNGKGPTLLAMSGNHGDEYEGQIATTKLIRSLEPKDIKGRVIVLPAANFPAAMAGMRTSPIDDGNLNRTFPGNRDGTPTWMISHYIESVLVPLADVILDLHSGGSSLLYIPSALVGVSRDKKRTAKLLELVEAFGAPVGYVNLGGGGDRTSTGAAERAGKLRLGTELGGAGMVGVESTRIAEEGVRRIMEHMGIAKPSALTQKKPKTRLMDVGGDDYYVYAPEAGLFEPYVDLGTMVKKGQVAGVVQFVDNPKREPVPAHFPRDGMVLCKRVPGRVERGDCLFHLATDRS